MNCVKGWAKLSTVVLVAASLVAGGLVPAAMAVGRGDRCHCPLMAKLGLAPCTTGGSLSAPMDCCRRGAAPAASLPTGTALPLPASVPVSPPCDAAVALELPGLPGEASAARHRLGLFTLHSIWRV